MAKRKATDGTEHDAHVLFDTLVECELRDHMIHVTGRSKNYERSGVMTLGYSRLLYEALGKCLAKIDGATNVVKMNSKR